MELPNQEGQMPLPLNSAYGGGGHVHMIHHDPPHHNHHILPSSAAPPPPQVLPHSNNGPIGVVSSSSNLHQADHIVPANNYKKIVKYKECLKNHAASMGGNATDGCGEFMPSGEEGTLEALTCSACNCHRNFHRKEIDGDHLSSNDAYQYQYHHPSFLSRAGRRMIMGMGQHKGILGTDPTTGALVPSRVAPAPPPLHHPIIMSYNNMGSMPSESDEQEGGVLTRQHHMVKKRYRTKFTQEQKEKMFNFAEKSGWKIQKQEESVVQQFCQEIGVRRRVLKVWMHNNKHNLAKKNISSDAPI